MEIIPTIDISQGSCVRLYKGLEGTEQIYSEDPLETLRIWIENKAKRLHIIDLDRAWSKGTNENLIKILLNKARGKLKVQVGGGLRNIDSAVKYLELGADRIILGTLAIKQPFSISTLSADFGSERVMIALDYKFDNIAIRGWKETTTFSPYKLANNLIQKGAGYIIFSSIEADGTLNGPDINNISKLIELIDSKKVYVGGGIRDMQDINNLKELKIRGVIIGKAFYENRIPLNIVNESTYNQ